MPAGTAANRAFKTPFPGLRSFSQDESELFFGREGQSDELARKLGQSRFVAVVGTSGSGKSSLVRAGLMPSLEGGCLVKAGSNWRIVDMRPGSRPIDNLAAALDVAKVAAVPIDPAILRNSSLALLEFASLAYQTKRLESDENLLILVDQFEELFRYKTRDSSMEDRDEKAAFVKLLLEVAKQREFPIYVVITMRSDFLGDCARFRDLPETINAGQYLVPRMTREQRREAIEGPVQMAGSAIAPRLVQRILNDVGEDPDQLPLMQHALMRTWYHWRNRNRADLPVDVEDYEAIGMLEDALSSHADKAYAQACEKVPGRGDQIVKRIFQRLRERDASGRETRRPTPLHELCAVSEASQEDVLAVLECFRREGRSFLMPPMSVDLASEREVDITHESLLRQWKRLQGPPSEDSGWLADEEESRRLMVRLAARAEEQVPGNPDYLRGTVLQSALDWWNKRKPTEAWAERYTPSFRIADQFLHESEKTEKREIEREAQREKEAELARIEQVRREEELKARQRKAHIASVLAVLAVIVALGAVAGGFNVYQLWRRAVAEQTRADAERARAEAQRERADAQQNLVNAEKQKFAERENELRKKEAEEAKKDAANANKARQQTSVQLLASKAALAGTEGESKLSLSMLLAAESMRRELLIDNEAVLSKGLPLLLTPLRPLPNSTAINNAMSTSTGLLVTGEVGFVRVWDPKSQTLVRSFNISGDVGAIGVSRDGALLAVGYDEKGQGVIQGFDLHTGETVGRHITDPEIKYISITDHGELAAATGGRRLTLWHWNDWSDAKGSAPQYAKALEILHTGGSIAFSSDQKLLALYDPGSSKITVQDSSSPDAADPPSWSAEERVEDIVFDPSNNNRLVSFDAGGTIKIWSVSSKSALTISAGPTANVQLSADGRLLATRQNDGTIRVWDSRDGREVGRALTAQGDTGNIAVDAVNGIVAFTQKGGPKLWGIADVPLPEGIIAAEISTDGALAMLRARTAAFPWVISEARPEPRLDKSVINSFLGVSGDLRQVAGSCEKGRALCVARLENSKVGELIQRSPADGSFTLPSSLTFSRDHRFVAGGVREFRANSWVVSVLIWDTRTQDAKPRVLPVDPKHSLRLLGFTPESDRCVVVDSTTDEASNSVVKSWNLNNNTFSAEVALPFRNQPDSMVFSYDGKWLATSSWIERHSAGETERDYEISIWRWPDAGQGPRIIDLDAKVNEMSFSSDNRFLLTAGDELFIRVWDLSSGREFSRVGILRRPILAMAFVNKDQQIISFDRYSVTISPWQPEDLMREACVRIGRSLSPAEWGQYLPDEKKKYFPMCDAYIHPRNKSSASN